MNTKAYIKVNGSTICIVLSLLLFFFSLLLSNYHNNADDTAARVSRRVEKRMNLLDRYISEALEADRSEWFSLEDIPEDMVIYRYVYDTLQSWCNQFSVSNDDISAKMIFQKIKPRGQAINSPLKEIREDAVFVNLGPKWYLIKAVSNDIGCKVIGGIEIQNMLLENIRHSSNGTPEWMKLSGKFSVMPLGNSGGAVIEVDDKPMFKIILETERTSSLLPDSILRWIAILLVCISAVLYLWAHRTIKVFVASTLIILTIAVTGYIWSLQATESTALFSPSIYAAGQVLNSFGALMIFNITVILLVFCLFLIHKVPIAGIMAKGRKAPLILYAISLMVIFAAVSAYTWMTLRSLILNSNISLELYILTRLSFYSVFVYLSYILLLFCLLLTVQMLSAVIVALGGRGYNLFRRKALVVFSLLSAVFFTTTFGIIGFQKERNRLMVASYNLAINRDLALELRLRNMETDIANDRLIATMSHNADGRPIIAKRLTEGYFNETSADYDIIVTVSPSSSHGNHQYDRRLFESSPIAENSRFVYIYDENGRSSYLGEFIFYSPHSGLSTVNIELIPKGNKDTRGYDSIFGKYAQIGEVDLPEYYSHAKYVSRRLVAYKGGFAYPTRIAPTSPANAVERIDFVRTKGYVHFVNKISNDEIIVISRKVRGILGYIITFSYLLFITFGLFYVIVSRGQKREEEEKIFRKNYYRSRITSVLFGSLFLILFAMSIVCISLIYKRNETNLYNIMSDKIADIKTELEGHCHDVQNYTELNTADFTRTLEQIGNNTKSDITLFTPSGKVFKSTTPEVFEKMVVGSRLNPDAYYNIRYLHQSYYISSEKFGKKKYYSLYAPVINADGTLIAIISAPYAMGQNFDLKQESLLYAAIVINIFLILFTAMSLVSSTIINALFKPLIQMSKTMQSIDNHGLEYIIYRQEDEISALVDAYNRMVHDLSVSTKNLALVEKEKAWSEMARQVAHEIKNPLTPIKLEIQRLIRLKRKNAPTWSETFDRVAAIVLEHIDILTDTANEFSTFAKLYSEEPVLIDLDKTLKDQILIFDNRENIRISYMGLSDAVVLAPRPQLIRVFVNLINNAIQAVEKNETAEDEKQRGRILISLRNAIKDGFYEIVFEDNGSGVGESDLGKLFTPNFTTKSGGTGLGLAICKNIVEKCGGEISYQKSFALEGACFIVQLPIAKRDS